MTFKRLLAGPIALLCTHATVWAQTPPVDAGRLLEQQRRLEQQPNAPTQPQASPLRDGAAPMLPGTADGATVTVRRFVLAGNTLLNDAALQEVLRPWLERPVTLAELRQAAVALERAYREVGWLAQATLPRQDVTGGELRIRIDEARFGTVRLAPPAADAANVRDVVPRLSERVVAILNAHVAAGEPLNLQTLQRALQIADELPGVAVAGSLQAGTFAGSTDVLLQIAGTRLARTDVSVDNQAVRTTGSERVNASLTLDSPWGYGEQLGVAGSATRGTAYVRGFASVPVGALGWRVGVNASALRYHVLDEYNTTTGMAPRGSGHTFGLDAQYPLIRREQAHWTAVLGIEQKQQKNEDDSATLGVMQPVGQARSRTASAGINGYAFDSLGRGGQTLASAQIATGKLNLDGSSAAQLAGDAQTVNTQGSYSLLRWSASRVQTLTPTLSLAASASGQFASRNLDSSEKIYLGGAGAINAYPSGEAGGSAGELVNVELRQQLGAHWQLAGFYNWGQVRQYADNERADGAGPITPDNSVTLRGLGASLSWRADNGIRVKATYAHRLGSNPLATPSGTDTDGSLRKNRLWVSASASF